MLNFIREMVFWGSVQSLCTAAEYATCVLLALFSALGIWFLEWKRSILICKCSRHLMTSCDASFGVPVTAFFHTLKKFRLAGFLLQDTRLQLWGECKKNRHRLISSWQILRIYALLIYFKRTQNFKKYQWKVSVINVYSLYIMGEIGAS